MYNNININIYYKSIINIIIDIILISIILISIINIIYNNINFK